MAYEQAPATIREVGDRLLEGQCLCEFSLLLLARDRANEARKHWRRGADEFHHQGAPEIEALIRSMRENSSKAGVPPLDEGTA